MIRFELQIYDNDTKQQSYFSIKMIRFEPQIYDSDTKIRKQ